MSSLDAVRRVLLVVLVVGALGAAGPSMSLGLFVDSHQGSGSFTASEYGGGGGGGGPTAEAAGPYEVFEDSSVQLDGTGSTSQGAMDSYSWVILSGPGSLSANTTSTPTFNAPTDVQSDTSVTVELTVNNKGQSDTDQATITVKDAGSGNQPPAARYTSSRSGNSPNAELDASTSSDTDGSITSYEWYIGQSDTSGTADYTGVSIKGKISAGTTVTLAVTDNDGATDTETKQIS